MTTPSQNGTAGTGTTILTLKSAAKAIVPAPFRAAIRRAFPYRDPSLSDEARYANYRPLREHQFINVGAGDFFHPRWTNIDHASAHYKKDQKQAFIEYDLNKLSPLPLVTGSVSLAFCSHVIEHVPLAGVRNLFSEVNRVLTPGGLFRVTCPDADLFYMTLRLGRAEYWNWHRGFFAGKGHVSLQDFALSQIASARVGNVEEREFTGHFNGLTKEAFLDWLTAPCSFDQDNPGRHIAWWNFEKCERELKNAGFKTIWRSSYGASLAAPMQDTELFDRTFPVISFYAEAAKSGGES